MPEIQWFAEDGSSIGDGEMYQQLPNGDLLITASASQAAELSTGIYTCVAKNEHGQDIAEAFFYATAV